MQGDGSKKPMGIYVLHVCYGQPNVLNNSQIELMGAEGNCHKHDKLC